jgi:hypothetical protein
MGDAVGLGLLERARDAAAREDWEQAFDLLMEAEAGGRLAPAELALLGEVAYPAGHLDVAIEAWERAHAGYLQSGDLVAAAGAGVRVAMHLIFDTALMAPVRGWLARAERLLEGLGATPAHAWLAVVRAYERMLTGDLAAARQWAQRAIEVGSKCDPAACAVARVAQAHPHLRPIGKVDLQPARDLLRGWRPPDDGRDGPDRITPGPAERNLFPLRQCQTPTLEVPASTRSDPAPPQPASGCLACDSCRPRSRHR